MRSPHPSGFDLSHLKVWRGLRPGMTREQVMAAIREPGVTTRTKADEPDWLCVDEDWRLELRFAHGSDGERLLQLAVEDEEGFRWGDKAVIGLPLHAAYEIVKPSAAGAGWQPDDAVTPSGMTPPADDAGVSDELLLSEGTLWLPEAGVGLVMADGVVSDVVWRKKEDVPRHFVSRVTQEQLELSRRPDLGEHLLSAWKRRLKAVPPTSRRNVLEIVLAVLLVLGLAFIGWKAWHEMLYWQNAAKVPGRVTGIELKPGRLAQKLYHVEYHDLEGRRQTATLERPDFYIEPKAPGETVIVCVAGSSPPRVQGPARANDAVFLTTVPWFLGVMGIYFALRLVLHFRSRNSVQPNAAGLLD